MQKRQNPSISRANGFPRPLRLLIITIMLCAAGITALHFSQSALAQATTPNTEIILSVNYDGTAPFTADPLDDGNGAHTPGLDLNGTNNVVRTFDLIQYRVDWNVNEVAVTNFVVRQGK